MNAGAQSCQRQTLDVLLSASEASDEYRSVAEHVESCPTCQTRLTKLAGDDSWWADAHALLSGEHPEPWQPSATGSWDAVRAEQAQHDTIRQTTTKLLDPPSHPEMLGRLGRFEIESVLGVGGMGVVLKAHDSELNRTIAIKLLAAHLAHSGAARERFAREGRAAAAVVHEHVVAVHNVESGGDAPYLVMQYVPGQSLQTRVDENGPLGVKEILRIGRQAASGLAAAHQQGLVHRDVKPSNILLENGIERAVLTDFGLARTIDDASLTQTGIIAGTPHYMSPEQAMGGPIDHRSDLFSLGSVLYFMATGHPPFRSEGAMAVLNRICREPHRPAWQVNQEIPDELSDLIDRLLEKPPARRLASAAQVERQLAALLSQLQEFGLGRRRRGTRLPFRRIGYAVAALLIAIAVGVGAWRLVSESERNATQPSPDNPIGSVTLDHGEQFQAELHQLGEATNAAGRPASFLHQSDRQWNAEVESLRQSLSELEAQHEPYPE